jgi:type IV pilus assembly protein PilM
VQSPAGARTRVVVVAARREMVERFASAAKDAGLHVEGIDLSAFAMVRALRVPADDGARLYVSVGGLTNVAVANASGCLFARAATGGLESIVRTLAERRALTLEHAAQWVGHVGLLADLEDLDGDTDLVAAARAALEEGVHQLADTVRNSLNFYRSQQAAEIVEHGVVTGPAVAIPGLVERLGQQLRLNLRTGLVSAAEDIADVGRLTVAAGLAGAARA